MAISSVKTLSAIIAASVLTTGCLDLSDDDNDNNSHDNRAITAETDNYIFEYTAGAISGGVGSYTLNVKAKDGSDVSGEEVSSTPVMTMNSGMEHSTPTVSTLGDLDEDGDFSTQVYYLMGTYNGNGEKQGNWNLNVEFDGETASLPMEISWTDGGHTTLYGGEDDKINGMSGMTPRPYYVFFEGKHHMNNMHMFSVYVATKEDMLNYPAVVAGSTLSKGSSMDMSNMNAMNQKMAMPDMFTVNSVSVEMCLENCMDDSAVWESASASTTKDGVYTISVTEHAADLSSIHVKLAVNGVDKQNAAGTSSMGMISLTSSNTDSSHNH